MVVQPGLCQTWSETPEDLFSQNEAHFTMYFTVGTWEYADAEGSTWQPIPLYEVPAGEAAGEDEFEVAMMVLPPTALIRFQPSSEYVS